MRSKTHIFLLSILAITSSSLASADVSVNVKSETVRYDDLRLISAVGAAVLYGRLRGAAERVCGGPLDSAQIAEQRRYNDCVHDALVKAVAEVNHPVLTQYVQTRRTAPDPSSSSVTSVTAVAKAR